MYPSFIIVPKRNILIFKYEFKFKHSNLNVKLEEPHGLTFHLYIQYILLNILEILLKLSYGLIIIP